MTRDQTITRCPICNGSLDLPGSVMCGDRHQTITRGRGAARVGGSGQIAGSPTLAAWHIGQIKRMSVEEADRFLCNLPSDFLLDIGAVLGLRLPRIGGDKPALIVGAMFGMGVRS